MVFYEQVIYYGYHLCNINIPAVGLVDLLASKPDVDCDLLGFINCVQSPGNPVLRSVL